jgi:hypothetical protein
VHRVLPAADPHAAAAVAAAHPDLCVTTAIAVPIPVTIAAAVRVAVPVPVPVAMPVGVAIPVPAAIAVAIPMAIGVPVAPAVTIPVAAVVMGIVPDHHAGRVMLTVPAVVPVVRPMMPLHHDNPVRPMRLMHAVMPHHGRLVVMFMNDGAVVMAPDRPHRQ